MIYTAHKPPEHFKNAMLSNKSDIDKSYFMRKNTYNFLSSEFIRYKFIKILDKLRIIPKNEIYITSIQLYKNSKNWRGYSTLEMQLMRNIGILSGYNNIIFRKLYELVYTNKFFTCLKLYYDNYHYSNRAYFKEYLIWIYFKINHTTINRRRYNSLFLAMEKMGVNTISQLSDEQLFVLVIGLNNTNLENALIIYNHIIYDQKLDIEEIKNIYRSVG